MGSMPGAKPCLVRQSQKPAAAALAIISRLALAAAFLAVVFVVAATAAPVQAAPPTLGTGAPAAADAIVGSSGYFWALNYGTGVYSRVQATAKYVGEHVVVWVADGAFFTDISANNLGIAFDNVVYPTVTAAYGSEPNPGIDGDPRVAILVYDFDDSPAGSIEGSFYPTDIDPGFASGGSEHSNYREMFSINSAALLMDPGSAVAIGAHEFAHLIMQYQDVMLDPLHGQGAAPEAQWLQEGLAVYAEHLCGYDSRAQSFLSAFQDDPNWDLTAWGGGQREHYGASYSFVSYLADREGPEFIKQLIHQPLDGIGGIDATLQVLDPTGFGDRFNGLFDDWIIASFLDDKPQLLAPYFFTNLDLHMRDTLLTGTPPILADTQVKNYGAAYLTFPATDRLPTFQVVVDGVDGSPLQAALVSWDSTGVFYPEITRLELANPAAGATVMGPSGYDRHTLVVWSRGAADSDVSYSFRYSGASDPPGGIQFLDMGGNDSFYENVSDLLTRGVINGYEIPKGSGLWFFQGQNKVLRSQFAKMIMLATGLHTPENEFAGHPTFGDVPQTPPDTFDFIEEAVSYGIIKGYGNGRFGPYDQITRSQLVAMIVRGAKAAGKPLSPYTGNERVFADVPVSQIPDSLYRNVMTAYTAGILSGSPGKDGRLYFNPTSPATRNHVAKMTANLIVNYLEAAAGSAG